MNNRADALGRAIDAVGGVGELASLLGISAQAVSQWDKVPPLRVIQVEQATGVSRHDLRPDLYPEPVRA